MKKYIIFAGEEFYPAGGMDDLMDQSFDTVDECEKHIDTIRSKRVNHGVEWYHIVDRETLEIVKGQPELADNYNCDVSTGTYMPPSSAWVRYDD